MNDQKFIMNWFIDNKKWVEADGKTSKNEAWRRYYEGPRDRLYRTGDLGRYLDSGDVEVTGRKDDQVCFQLGLRCCLSVAMVKHNFRSKFAVSV